MTRSQMAFIRGVLGKVAMTSSPSALKTSPNAVVKTGSRSWIRNRSVPRRSPKHRFHHQEVAGDDRMRLDGQELPPRRPGPAGCRIDARGMQDLPHRGRGDRVPQPRQLTVDPPVPPGRVLPRHPDDQRLDRGPGGRSPWLAPAGAVPLAGDEVTVPAQDRGRDGFSHATDPAANPSSRHETEFPSGTGAHGGGEQVSRCRSGSAP